MVNYSPKRRITMNANTHRMNECDDNGINTQAGCKLLILNDGSCVKSQIVYSMPDPCKKGLFFNRSIKNNIKPGMRANKTSNIRPI